MSPATQHGSAVTVAAGQGYTLPLRPEDPQIGGLEAEQQTLNGAGLSEDVISMALACTTPTSWQVYDRRW